MGPELVNLYIQRLLKEIEELNKNRLLLETKIQYTEQLNVSLSEKVKLLEEKDIENVKEVNTSKK